MTAFDAVIRNVRLFSATGPDFDSALEAATNDAIRFAGNHTPRLTLTGVRTVTATRTGDPLSYRSHEVVAEMTFAVADDQPRSAGTRRLP